MTWHLIFVFSPFSFCFSFSFFVFLLSLILPPFPFLLQPYSPSPAPLSFPSFPFFLSFFILQSPICPPVGSQCRSSSTVNLRRNHRNRSELRSSSPANFRQRECLPLHQTLPSSLTNVPSHDVPIFSINLFFYTLF
ncbi:unnamed protein product [Cuscuta epithymum]|uniref:Uncharacterized protein n=1 Tax=Cuscuta epithymum TaxID=186058 RepID=A0AAV0C4T3_9ASTE|nr:unnamed protein product [Cuscuta epithymum]